MATTSFSSSSASTVKLWSARTLYDFCSDTALLGYMIRDGVITKKDDTSRGKGDRITVSFLNRLTDTGLLGSQSADGLDSELTYYTDNVNIDQLRIPVSIPAVNTIDTQRVQYDLKKIRGLIAKVISENLVNSGKALAKKLVGNPEPSLSLA